MVALGWAVSLALFSVILFAFYLVHTPIAVATLISLGLTLVLVAVGAYVLCRARGARGYQLRALDTERGVTMTTIAGLGIASTQVALSSWMAWHSPLAGYDAWALWSMKARMFAAGGPSLSYFTVSSATHPEYPLNLPLAEAALFHISNTLGLQLAALIGPACLGALLLLFYCGLTRLYGRGAAAVATGLLSLVPILTTQASLGYADVPLTMYAGGASLYLLLWWRLRHSIDAVFMGILAGCAMWTKKEGSIIAALVVLAYCLGEMLPAERLRPKRLRNVAQVIVVTVALPLPWLLFTAVHHSPTSDFLPLTPHVFLAHVDRLPQILLFLMSQLTTFSEFGLFWVGLIGALILAARRLSRHGYGLLLILLGQLGIYAVSFVFSAWDPYIGHVTTALYRLVMQAVPLALLLLAEVTYALGTATRNRGHAADLSGGAEAGDGNGRTRPRADSRPRRGAQGAASGTGGTGVWSNASRLYGRSVRPAAIAGVRSTQRRPVPMARRRRDSCTQHQL